MTRRGIVVRMVASVVMGMMTTVGVAWGIALKQTWDDPTMATGWFNPDGSDVSSVHVEQSWQSGSLIRNFRPHGIDSGGEIQPSPVSFAGAKIMDRAEVDLSWGLARRVLVKGDLVRSGEEAHGWPCVALYSTCEELTDPSSRRGGIRVRDDPLGFYDKFLPLLPIWRGIMVDTGVFSAAWCVLLLAPVPVMGALRKRRGRCPGCGYDLQRAFAAGCSECGWNRPRNGEEVHSRHG